MLSRGFRQLPRSAAVLMVWAAATLLSLLVLRLGAQDTGQTVWAPARPTWMEHASFWDSGWYERIVREGYPTQLPTGTDGTVQQNAWAFMPLLPLLASALSWTGWSFYACATAVSLAASAGAALVMDRWLAPHVGKRASLWAVALFWCSPCAVVLQLPYAESLGLLLVAVALWLAERGRFLAATPAVIGAAFARPLGVPLTAALGLWWLWEVARSRRGRRERLRLLGLTAVAAASALAWPAIAWAVTGRADAYTATETSWRGGELTPLLPWLTRSQWWVGGHLGWLLLIGVAVLAVLALSAPALRQVGEPAWLWCVAYTLYLLVFFDPTTSVFRLLLPLAPVAWALAAHTPPRVRAALLAVGLVGQVFWVSWVWDGYSAVTWVP
ncbi:hypothetical protein [Actinomyces sp. MRS3W]|uniref:hypothetical protein n=1 Tax=Actinomyces sp. MRS3W TaxID=2800796 RepID=UPI0028FDAA93|nr:hypothetical protein [Actinomyces sp. MRS3W]MDU0348680.1 hypothetical protein [Actinomyces sp. MRS3W]